MRHLRTDYNAIQPFPVKRPHIVKIDGETVDADKHRIKALGRYMEPLIPDDEPVFLLRGQDPAAAAAVHFYAVAAQRCGAAPELVAAVNRWADEMEAWAERVQHGPPDVPAGFLPSGG